MPLSFPQPGSEGENLFNQPKGCESILAVLFSFPLNNPAYLLSGMLRQRFPGGYDLRQFGADFDGLCTTRPRFRPLVSGTVSISAFVFSS